MNWVQEALDGIGEWTTPNNSRVHSGHMKPMTLASITTGEMGRRVWGGDSKSAGSGSLHLTCLRGVQREGLKTSQDTQAWLKLRGDVGRDSHLLYR